MGVQIWATAASASGSPDAMFAACGSFWHAPVRAPVTGTVPDGYDLVATVTPVDVGAPDTAAGERRDLIDLYGQRAAVPRRAGDRLCPEHELAAGGARWSRQSCISPRTRT